MNWKNGLVHDFIVRWKLLRDPEVERERRVFALLELCCFPASFLTIFGVLPAEIVATRCFGWTPPHWWSGIWLNILLSAAIGYLTNFIALEMLFKPYYRSWKHPLTLLSFGYWKQGLVPRNKNRIGEELGRQVETRLLDPEAMADELCAMVLQLLHNPDTVGNIRNSVQTMLRRHEEKIMEFLVPRIESTIAEAVARIITPERIRKFWRLQIAPFLRDESTRGAVADNIVRAFQRRSPQMIEILRRELRDFSRDYFATSIPFGIGATSLSNGLIEVIHWDEVERRLNARLADEEVYRIIEQEVMMLVEKLGEYLNSGEGHQKLEAFSGELKERLNHFLHEYLHRMLPRIAGELIQSENLWQWVEEEFLPVMRPRIEAIVRVVGRREIIARLNLSERVSQAIERQKVEEFHDMINAVASQHLGAIQVLGYILGGVVGALMNLL